MTEALTRDVNVVEGLPPTPEAEQARLVLQQAVHEALVRKRRLGQYAVMWINGRPQRVPPEQLPEADDTVFSASPD